MERARLKIARPHPHFEVDVIGEPARQGRARHQLGDHVVTIGRPARQDTVQMLRDRSVAPRAVAVQVRCSRGLLDGALVHLPVPREGNRPSRAALERANRRATTGRARALVSWGRRGEVG